MNEISFGKCKRTFRSNYCNFSGGGGGGASSAGVRSSFKKFKLILFLCVILIFYIKSIYSQQQEQQKQDYFEDKSDYGNRNFRLLDQNYVGRKSLSIDTKPSHLSLPEVNSSERKYLGNHHERNCTTPAINEFPSDGLTRKQRKRGWILLHILIALYCFWFLAIICDEYLVPAIEQICCNLSIQRDVVAATFMSAATSVPELFVNMIGTFITEGDIGLGTIVGSAVFNILAVVACCGFFVGDQYLKLDWWSVSRDCLMYCVAVLALIFTLYDGRIMWYEALLLVIGYFLYMTVMFHNDKMKRTARRIISKYRRKIKIRPFRQVTEFTPLLHNNNDTGSMCSLSSEAFHSLENGQKTCVNNFKNSLISLNSTDSDGADDPWQRNGQNPYEYGFRWPITFLLWLTVPDSRKHPRWKYLTFVLSIAWIGAISYIVAYVITIIGDTLSIPDSVMGLTILAAGMSVPEAVSSIIVTKQGNGAMGISNSLGSNTFDIFLCLGIPWLVKAYFLSPADQPWVTLNSTGITYSTIFLLSTLFGLYIAFLLNRFVLNWKIGITCSLMYIAFMVIASMIELNVFFPVNLPVCKH